jgi:hypothetical protein
MNRNGVRPEGTRRAPGRWPRPWPRRIAPLIGLVAAAAIALAGCGGESSNPGNVSGGSSRLAQALSQALNFSRCMRAHGITGYPDPTQAGGQISITVRVKPGSNLNPHSPQYQAARNGCKSFSPSSNLTPAQKAAANARALKYSQCMRSHGVSGYPDPNGQGTLAVQAGGGIDPRSSQFQNAQKACQSLDNGFNMDTSNFPS